MNDGSTSNQPFLNGVAFPVTIPTGGFTASTLRSFCPCIFNVHATTDGTITTGQTVETLGSLMFTATTATAGTFTGIEDQNAGGSLTVNATISSSYTVDANGVGTITPMGGNTIDFIVVSNADLGNDIVVEMLDESTGGTVAQPKPNSAPRSRSPARPTYWAPANSMSAKT